MTYNVSNGTLNSTILFILYYLLYHLVDLIPWMGWVKTCFDSVCMHKSGLTAS